MRVPSVIQNPQHAKRRQIDAQIAQLQTDMWSAVVSPGTGQLSLVTARGSMSHAFRSGVARRARPSFDPQIRRLDDLAPLHRFVSDELVELGGRQRHRIGAEIGKLGLHGGIGERGVDRFAKRLDYGRRQL